MIRSLFSAATGMIAQQLNLDVIANNLANVNTTGFKSEKPVLPILADIIAHSPTGDLARWQENIQYKYARPAARFAREQAAEVLDKTRRTHDELLALNGPMKLAAMVGPPTSLTWASSACGSKGLSRKSQAPARIASRTISPIAATSSAVAASCRAARSPRSRSSRCRTRAGTRRPRSCSSRRTILLIAGWLTRS